MDIVKAARLLQEHKHVEFIWWSAATRLTTQEERDEGADETARIWEVKFSASPGVKVPNQLVNNDSVAIKQFFDNMLRKFDAIDGERMASKAAQDTAYFEELKRRGQAN